MKAFRNFTLVIAALLMLSFVGCSDSSDDEEVKPTIDKNQLFGIWELKTIMKGSSNITNNYDVESSYLVLNNGGTFQGQRLGDGTYEAALLNYTQEGWWRLEKGNVIVINGTEEATVKELTASSMTMEKNEQGEGLITYKFVK
ncbi:hypothetical protein [Rufibacter ruber]|uniref:hypothetical protein n=1 Tax=Rufibacter ruber TaxID=1783499 RepID=UPI00082C38E0|nr:hypothetical protein [Rufibacter ruber]